MLKEPIYDGLLDLVRLGEAVKEAKEEGELFKDHNRWADKVVLRIKYTTEALIDLFSMENGETTSTIRARIAIEAPRKTYNQRSTLGLYLEWVQIRKSILDDLNEFCTDADSFDAWKEIESLDLVIEKPFKS